MRKQKGRSPRVVSTSAADGGIKEFGGQGPVEAAIFQGVHDNRFYLAEQAPICREPLRDDFGYLADTEVARQVLAGTYDYPPQFDAATREILQECAAIRLQVGSRLVDTTLSTGTWKERWPKAREETSSSISGRHFGHYIAGSKSWVISKMHALKTTLCLKLGISLERWTNGLSVMFEKMFGCSLVEKI